MIVAVGSNNKAKLKAVETGFRHYFKDAKIKGVEIESGVRSQPISLEEIVKGAKNRAKKAFEQGAEFGIGIEAGVFPFPESNSGYMDTACCSIFDGKKFYLGCSPMFEYPKKVVEKIFKEKKEVSDIFVELFGNAEKHDRHDQGAIGFLTNGIIPRSQLLESAVVCALTQVINRELYNK